jgi:hypothetical protein
MPIHPDFAFHCRMGARRFVMVHGVIGNLRSMIGGNVVESEHANRSP